MADDKGQLEVDGPVVNCEDLDQVFYVAAVKVSPLDFTSAPIPPVNLAAAGVKGYAQWNAHGDGDDRFHQAGYQVPPLNTSCRGSVGLIGMELWKVQQSKCY